MRLAPFVDEAFYWQESRHLAWGYSDLPPVTAWLIRAGETLVGQHGVLAMRWPFLLLGALLPWMVVGYARRQFGARVGWQAGLWCLALPLAGTLGVLALPDVPLTVAFMAAVWPCPRRWRATAGGTGWRWAWRWAGLDDALPRGHADAGRAGAAAAIAARARAMATPGPVAGAGRGARWACCRCWCPTWQQHGAGLDFQLLQRNPWSFHAERPGAAAGAGRGLHATAVRAVAVGGLGQPAPMAARRARGLGPGDGRRLDLRGRLFPVRAVRRRHPFPRALAVAGLPAAAGRVAGAAGAAPDAAPVAGAGSRGGGAGAAVPGGDPGLAGGHHAARRIHLATPREGLSRPVHRLARQRRDDAPAAARAAAGQRAGGRQLRDWPRNWISSWTAHGPSTCWTARSTSFTGARCNSIPGAWTAPACVARMPARRCCWRSRRAACPSALQPKVLGAMCRRIAHPRRVGTLAFGHGRKRIAFYAGTVPAQLLPARNRGCLPDLDACLPHARGLAARRRAESQGRACPHSRSRRATAISGRPTRAVGPGCRCARTG